MFGLDLELSIILGICLVTACIFEFINGFHDTANAVATVIYSKALKPIIAVMWSGMFNFLGVFLGGITVAMGIMNLLPASALYDPNIYHSLSLILSLILTAIFWNFGTWYMGIPCSSSHTLLGSIFGVGIAFMLLPDAGNVALNWMKVKDAGLSLLISPLVGFGLSMGLMMLLKKLTKNNPVFFEHDETRTHPPLGFRCLSIFTCTAISFAHGQNDGQKGVGLVMIILIALAPMKFAVDTSKSPAELLTNITAIESIISNTASADLSLENKLSCQLILYKTQHIQELLRGVSRLDGTQGQVNYNLRRDLSSIKQEATKLFTKSIEQPKLPLPAEQTKELKQHVAFIKGYIEYAPIWVILMISISLGLGTMIGWKRIVVTVGEKIGKTPLTYAQGASAELVGAMTIAVSSGLGLPVSTTHVLSSGIAGSMVAKNGFKNLRKRTVRNILTAWLITLPVTIVMAGGLFLLLNWLVRQFA